MTNTNCLRGFRCFNCGGAEPFRIEIATLLTVFDHGGHDMEHCEWTEASPCECCQCGARGRVGEFRKDI